jgi:YVTN family beta-propeller protein
MLAMVAAGWALPPLPICRGSEPDAGSSSKNRLRQPVAIVCVDNGKTVLVANRRSGSISIIDAASRRVVGERDVGQGLADLVPLPEGRHLVAIDQDANELLLLALNDGMIDVVDRAKVPPVPVRLVVLSDGSSSLVCVSSLWSRRLTFVQLTLRGPSREQPAFSAARSLDLPFCPRELAAFRGSFKVVVADAFAGHVTVVDPKRPMIETVWKLPGHNIRGLAFTHDGRSLLLTHQILSRLAHTSFDDVHWGLLVRNHLRLLQTDALLKPGPDSSLLEGSQLFDLGDVGYAAGDPAGVTFDVRGNLIIALAGVDEVGITPSPDQAPRRTAVGHRPTAVTPSPDGTVVYIAGMLDDSVSVVAIATGQRLASIALGPRPELTAADRGERLFYSAKLSHDGWMSCHSCHVDGHTNNQLSDTLGDGSFGAPKRVPSLLGVGATGPWTWTGSISRLEDQVQKSIATTMHGPKATSRQVADLAAYLRTLSPPPASPAALEPKTDPASARGRDVFRARKCDACHVPPEYTSPERYDVGLVDEVGNHEFNPPSLRGVRQRDLLLHDGRAHSLTDMLQQEQHPGGVTLSSREIADLVAFLATL